MCCQHHDTPTYRRLILKKVVDKVMTGEGPQLAAAGGKEPFMTSKRRVRVGLCPGCHAAKLR